MKKSYLMIAAAVALFTACAEKDTYKEILNEEVAIDFANGYIGKTTKAELTNEWFKVTNNDFGVYGFKGTTKIFSNEQVKWSGSDWTHTTKRFWDKAASNYEFYAYAPYGQAASFDETNKLFGFTEIVANPIVDILTANADLAVATPMTGISYDKCTKKEEGGHGAGHVEFIFNHVLSKLSFYVKTDLNVAASGGDVKELKVNAISLDFPTATSASWAQSTANSVSGAITYTGYQAKNGINSETGKEIPANYETVVIQNASTDVTTTATQIGKIFIVAPVTASGTSSEHIFGVKVDYTIKYNDDVTESSTAYGVIGGGDGTTGTTQYKPAENTNYAITLNIHPEEIQFCVDKINNWATETALNTTVK